MLFHLFIVYIDTSCLRRLLDVILLKRFVHLRVVCHSFIGSSCVESRSIGHGGCSWVEAGGSSTWSCVWRLVFETTPDVDDFFRVLPSQDFSDRFWFGSIFVILTKYLRSVDLSEGRRENFELSIDCDLHPLSVCPICKGDLFKSFVLLKL